jgi:tripartite-type tricarboxylate transporter receptor subunit TctC
MAALAATAALAAMPGHAQDQYPSKPIRWVVGVPAGGGSDFLARTVANAMSEQMGRFNMVVATGVGTGIDSIAQAINAMRKSPGKYSYGSVGAGAPRHFAMGLFSRIQLALT